MRFPMHPQKHVVLKGLVLLLAVGLQQCTYERPHLYKKGYIVGKSEFLHFDGFYSDSTSIITEKGNAKFLYPIFFYRDGSVIQMGAIRDTTQLRKLLRENTKGTWGYWGNYTVRNDSISIEYIASSGGSLHHKRLTQQGLLKNGRLFLTDQAEGNKPSTTVTKELRFYPFEIKPDSSANWIRNKKKY